MLRMTVVMPPTDMRTWDPRAFFSVNYLQGRLPSRPCTRPRYLSEEARGIPDDDGRVRDSEDDFHLVLLASTGLKGGFVQ